MFDRVSVLVPVFNNAETLRDLAQQITNELAGLHVEIAFVDDASHDGSVDVLRAMASDEIKVIYNDKNIGQQASIRKGLAVCTGQAVVVMDADLQDPPEAISTLLRALFDGGHDAVFATRIGRYQSGFRMLTSRAFRFLIRRLTNLPHGAGGFVAMTDDVARTLAAKTNPRFYLAGMIGSGNYRIHAVQIERNTREVGQSAYSGTMRLSQGLSNLTVVFKERFSFHDER